MISELRGLTEVAKGKPLVLVALGVPYFADIKQENNTASATVNIKNEVIKLTMQTEEIAGDRRRPGREVGQDGCRRGRQKPAGEWDAGAGRNS